MMPYGAATRKPTILWSNQEGADDLKLPCDPSQESTVQTSTRYVDSNGVTRVTGTKDLKGTQSYPVKFGDGVALKHLCATLPMGEGIAFRDTLNSDFPKMLSDDPWDDACLDEVLAALGPSVGAS